LQRYFIPCTAIVFVYDYHPLSTTVMDLHLAPKSMAPRANGRLPQPPAPLNERVFWSYCAQLVSAIKAAHTAGLAVRTIEPTKILVTGKNRCVGQIAAVL
jgi:PAB-dependent poly(A)-specific ribonuclease subunit 3